MTRQQLAEQILRLIYGGHAPDDASITVGLVNTYMNQGIALAAKQNYKENLQIEGVAFVNNSFYTTFKAIAITEDEQFLYKITLPQLPIGVGATEGIGRLIFKDALRNVSFPGVPLSENQVGIYRSMRVIPNKTLFYPEGIYCYIISTISLTEFTASITMISGGDATDMNSVLNVPDDFIPIIIAFVREQLVFERNMPVPAENDGQDAIRTT